MFDRYTIASDFENFQKIIKLEKFDGYKPTYNASPTKLLPVITNESPGGLSYFYWGLPPSWSKNKSVTKKLVNANVEELESKSSYRQALERRQCLIPADGIYLWKKISMKGKVPYRLILGDEEAFFIAGLWDEFEDDQGKVMHTFLMITFQPEDSFGAYGSELPVILKNENTTRWIDHGISTDERMAIVNNVPTDRIVAYPVSPQIINVSIDHPGLIKPSKPVDQFGNYSLFD